MGDLLDFVNEIVENSKLVKIWIILKTAICGDRRNICETVAKWRSLHLWVSRFDVTSHGLES
jgi:hypothetical protein